MVFVLVVYRVSYWDNNTTWKKTNLNTKKLCGMNYSIHQNILKELIYTNCGFFHLPNLDTMILSNVILHLKWDSRRMRPVKRGCLLLLGTRSHLQYARGSVLAHLFSLTCNSYTCVSRLIILWYLSHFIFNVGVFRPQQHIFFSFWINYSSQEPSTKRRSAR
jgi:hypothetical protein